ncbi:MAG: DUF4838 domain-containing protein [Clostridia bacterium]|nr:DUF4838 domain-containing protein [Clostridia bacterium]
MKKLLSVILSALMLGACLTSALGASAADEALLPDDAVILIPADATAQESAAANRLRDLIAEISGVTHEVVTENPGGAYEISVGRTDKVDADLAGMPDGSYVIKSYGGGVAIVGAGVRGNIYGVYDFIRQFGGGRYYISSEFSKSRDSVLLPEKADISYVPAFEYTDTDWRSPRGVEYSLANGLNGSVYRSISTELGGTVGYISWLCHTLSTEFCPRGTYFDAHPEYYALHDGERTPKQLCLTNENVYEIVRDEVLALCAAKCDPSLPVQIISLTQDDNQEFCECDACKALDEANGSHAGTMLTFANRIADDVKAAGYDNIAIDTFAYQYTRTTPTNVVPRDNVIVRLCSIECCFSHPLNDPKCERNVSFMKDLEGWSRICDRLYIWDYTTDYSHTMGIFPDFGVLQTNMQVFAEHGVKGVYEEGNYYINACDTEFGELRAYLLSRLLRDPYCDYDREMRDFLNDYYGAAGEPLYEFLSIVTKDAQKKHCGIGVNMEDAFTLNAIQVMKCDKLWNEAKAAVADDETRSARVLRSELSWRYVKACHRWSEFAGVCRGKDARIQLHDDLFAYGVTMYNEWNQLTEDTFDELYMYGPARYWFRTEFSAFENFVRKLFFFFIGLSEKLHPSADPVPEAPEEIPDAG